MISLLPTEIMDIIVMKTGDLDIAYTLKKYISQYTFDQIEQNVFLKLHKQQFKETLYIFKRFKYKIEKRDISLTKLSLIDDISITASYKYILNDIVKTIYSYMKLETKLLY